MSTPQIVDVNLLPGGSRPIEASPSSLVFAGVVLIAILALVPLSLATQSQRTDAVAAEQRAEEAQDKLADLQLDLTTHRGLRVALDTAEKQSAVLAERRQAFQGGRNPLARDLAVVLAPETMPAGIAVTHMSSEAAILRVIGVAPGPIDALDFARALAPAGPYESVQLRSFAPGEQDAGEFTLDIAR